MGFCTKVPSRFNSRRRTQSPRHQPPPSIWPRACRGTSPRCAIDSITERTESSRSVDHVAISATDAIASGSSRTCQKQSSADNPARTKQHVSRQQPAAASSKQPQSRLVVNSRDLVMIVWRCALPVMHSPGVLAFAVVSWTIGQNLVDVARWRFVSDVPHALPRL